MRPDTSARGVLATSLEVYEDYDITTEPAATWNELLKDDWNTVQRWPNIILPPDRPNIVTVTVTTTATTQSAAISKPPTSGPSTSAGGGGSSSAPGTVASSIPATSTSSTPAATTPVSSSLPASDSAKIG